MMYILYSSQCGTTKRYAEMLSEATGLPCRGDPAQVPVGERVIFFSWVKAGKIIGFRQAFQRFDLQAVIAVGLAPTGTRQKELRKRNSMRDTTKLFTLQGGYQPDKLTGMEKTVMKLVTKSMMKSIKRKKDPTSEDLDLLDLLQNGGDRVSKDNMTAVMKWYFRE